MNEKLVKELLCNYCKVQYSRLWSNSYTIHMRARIGRRVRSERRDATRAISGECWQTMGRGDVDAEKLSWRRRWGCGRSPSYWAPGRATWEVRSGAPRSSRASTWCPAGGTPGPNLRANARTLTLTNVTLRARDFGEERRSSTWPPAREPNY